MHLFVENNFIRNLFLVNIVLVIIIEQVSWLLYIGFLLSVPPSGSQTTTTRPSAFAVASRSSMSLHTFAMPHSPNAAKVSTSRTTSSKYDE